MRLKRSGFSLVLSLTIMAAMVLMVIVLASFLQVESRLAQSHAGYLRARFNAVAAAKIAVGQLQQLAGPDQRVTMRADMYANNDVAVGNVDASTIAPSRPSSGNNFSGNNAPSAGKLSHQKRYLTGVWATGGVTSTAVRDWDVTNPNESRLFLGWLSSSFDVGADPELSGTTPNYVANRSYVLSNGGAPGSRRKADMTEGQALIDGLKDPIDASPDGVLVPLVSFGTVALPTGLTSFQRNYMGAVDARPQPMPGPAFAAASVKLGANGRYAFWVGDEGVKAKVNLPDYYGATPGGSWLSTEDWDKGFAGTANQRNAIGVIGAAGTILKEGTNPKGTIPAGFNFDTWRANDITNATGNPQAYQLGRAVGASNLAAWAAKQAGVNAGQAMNDAVKTLWHDITTYSFSALTDTYNGGVKTDLSTAFELPYSQYRGTEVYPGQKDPAVTANINQRKPSFFHGAPNNFTAGGVELSVGVELDYNRPNLADTLGTANQLLAASPRSSEWAGRYVQGVLGSSYAKLKSRNGNETPERLGFVYEAPLRSALFNTTRELANTERANNALGTFVTRISSYPYSESTATAPENLSGRITRGPTWDLYRNFYRMYKRENEATSAANANAMRGQQASTADTVIAHGVEPLSFATGNRNAPYQRSRIPVNPPPFVAVTPPDRFYGSGGSTSASRYFYRNNFSGPSDTPLFQAEQRLRYPNILINKYASVTNFDRLGLAKPTLLADATYDTPQTLSTRTWPTTMSLTPSIIRFSMVFSAVVDNSAIGVTVDPVVVVHNPYDCPIEFEGVAMVTNGQAVPYIFDVKLKNWSFFTTRFQYGVPVAGGSGAGEPQPKKIGAVVNPLRLQLTSGDITLGEVALGDGELDNRSFSFRVVAPSGGKFRLEPGEIKVLSTPFSSNTNYTSNRASNTAILGGTGFDFGAKALYKMTPFAHVRYRQNGDVTTQMDTIVPPWNPLAIPPKRDARLWTWAFQPISPNTNKAYVDAATYDLPDCGFIGDYCTNYGVGPTLGTLWNQVAAARDVHDALPSWDGSALSLRRTFDAIANAGPGTPNGGVYPKLYFQMRNSGWVNYDNCVVGEESANYAGVTNSGAPYVFPRLHTGTTNVGGHQAWNFYLIGNKSIDGQTLDQSRRWFGAPDYSSTTALSNFVYEGTETAPGVNLVDEPLLLSFNGLTAGWPQYGNDNAHSSNLTVPNEDYLKNVRGAAAPREPDYTVPTGTKVDGLAAGTSGTNNVFGPTNGDPEFGRPEVNGGRAGTLNGRVEGIISTTAGTNGVKQQFFVSDFVLRSADMSSDSSYKWYPRNSTTTLKGAQAFTGSATAWNSRSPSSFETLMTPAEMLNAPMSPYFLSVRPQSAHLYAYDGKAHAPIGWVLSMKPLSYAAGTFGNLQVSNSKDNAYWGASVDPSGSSGRSDVILFPVPRRPLLSLAQLGSVGFAQVITDADFTVGSSFANPGIKDLTKITDWPGPKDGTTDDQPIPENGYVAKVEGTRVIRNFAQVRTDHAFAANLSLWDSFYFSGLNLQAPSYSIPAFKSNFPGGPDLPIDTAVAASQVSSLRKASGNNSIDLTSFTDIKAALEAGYNPLANKRVKFMPDGTAASASDFPAQTEFPHPAYLGRNSLYDGGFNVNSTSKAAWKAVLAGMRGQTLPDGATASGTVLTRFARSFKPTTGDVNAWNDYRELTDDEIEELAGLVVKEVRDRGPFMSLADFINRRLLNTDQGLKGALQAALDASTINGNATTGAIKDAGGTFNHPAAPDYSSSIGLTDTRNYKKANVWDFLNVYSAGSPGAASPNVLAPRFPRLAAYAPKGKASDNPIGLSGVTAGLGAPKVVTQMDILNSVGPNLTARSDTFTVRAYGEALDNAGNTIGRAWIEVVVQRTPYYVLPSSRGPGYEESTRRKLAYRPKKASDPEFAAYDNDPIVDMYESLGSPANLPSNATQAEKDAWPVNRILGRRFKATSIRWLNSNEI